MPGLSLHTEACVLQRLPPAERFQQLQAFSADHGPLRCLQRIATRPAAAPLDLFDEADLWLESSSQGRTWFIKEARVLAHHGAIGRSYDALRLASAFTGIIARNPVHEDGWAGLGALLRQTLAAFGGSNRPDVVFFKALYCFARDEGYPVKQEWARDLGAADRAAVADLLGRPLAEQAAAAAAVTRLTRRLEDYLRDHTEILLE